MEEKVKEDKVRTVDSETAGLEVKKFLDLKRVPEEKREKLFESNIANLVRAIQDGNLTFDFEKKRATYKLLFPLLKKDGGKIEKLEMRFHMGVTQAFSNMKGIEPDDINEKCLGMTAALSSLPIAVLKLAKNEFDESGLELADFNALRDYALFFLV